MKNTMILSLVLFFVPHLQASADTALRRSNGLLRFIIEHEGVRNYGLGSIIGARCSRYLPILDRAPCKSAVNKMVKLLDYDVIITQKDKANSNGQWNPKAFVFVAFKTHLISLLSSPQTVTYLKDLNQKLYQHVLGNMIEANVWSITQEHFGNDYLTSRAMATLFQDTSTMKLHLAYLEHTGINGNKSFQQNKELLSRSIDTINLILDSSEENYRKLFYPKQIQKDLNRNIYHFYVPLFLSKSLEREGFKKQYAFLSTLMLTLSYEFITASKDYRYLYNDPERITDLYKIKDIYAGYCGSKIGVRGMHFYKSFEIIRASFERSTEDSVELLIRP